MIQTNRLHIRKMLAEDWKAFRHIVSDFTKSPNVIYDHPFPAEDSAIQELASRFADSGLFFAVFIPDCQDMIGYVCFHNEHGAFDLGYCFHSAYQGNGFAFESCLAVMDYVEQHYEVNHFTASTAIKNIPSCKLLKKLGFTLTSTETLSFHKDAHGNDISFEGGNFICQKGFHRTAAE